MEIEQFQPLAVYVDFPVVGLGGTGENAFKTLITVLAVREITMPDSNDTPELLYFPRDPRAIPHSGPGVASFVIALGFGLMAFIAIAVALYDGATRPRGVPVPRSPAAAAIGLLVCAGVLGAVVGLVAGIIGLCSRDRKKLFAILGVVLNGLIIVAVIGIIALGALARAAGR